jgi:hypothetical protein
MSTQLNRLHVGEWRSTLLSLSNAELLRLGMVAKYKCSQEANLSDQQRLRYAAQLDEARKEWDRRFPTLPLSATFYRDES